MADKKKRGFGSMDPQKQREIASKGGRAAHQKGTAHEFTPEEARAAGRRRGLLANQSKGAGSEFRSPEGERREEPANEPAASPAPMDAETSNQPQPV